MAKQGGPLLNNSLNVEYIKSRCLKDLIIVGKAKALNPLLKAEFYEKAKANNTIVEI